MALVPSVVPGFPRFVTAEIFEQRQAPIVRREQAYAVERARLLDLPRHSDDDVRPSEDGAAGW